MSLSPKQSHSAPGPIISWPGDVFPSPHSPHSSSSSLKVRSWPSSFLLDSNRPLQPRPGSSLQLSSLQAGSQRLLPEIGSLCPQTSCDRQHPSAACCPVLLRCHEDQGQPDQQLTTASQKVPVSRAMQVLGFLYADSALLFVFYICEWQPQQRAGTVFSIFSNCVHCS